MQGCRISNIRVMVDLNGPVRWNADESLQQSSLLMALRALGTASKIAAAAVAGGSAYALTASVAHSSDALHPTPYPWSHNGAFAAYDAGRYVVVTHRLF